MNSQSYFTEVIVARKMFRTITIDNQFQEEKLTSFIA